MITEQGACIHAMIRLYAFCIYTAIAVVPILVITALVVILLAATTMAMIALSVRRRIVRWVYIDIHARRAGLHESRYSIYACIKISLYLPINSPDWPMLLRELKCSSHSHNILMLCYSRAFLTLRTMTWASALLWWLPFRTVRKMAWVWTRTRETAMSTSACSPEKQE